MELSLAAAMNAVMGIFSTMATVLGVGAADDAGNSRQSFAEDWRAFIACRNRMVEAGADKGLGETCKQL